MSCYVLKWSRRTYLGPRRCTDRRYKCARTDGRGKIPSRYIANPVRNERREREHTAFGRGRSSARRAQAQAAAFALRSSMPHDVAIVVGGSVAGLCTAAALSSHFAKVLVLHDATPENPGPVQAQHTHLLLQGGSRAMEELLPGFTQAMLLHGARQVDFQREVNSPVDSARCANAPPPSHACTHVV